MNLIKDIFITLLISIFLSFNYIATQATNNDSYTAAVVDYAASYDKSETVGRNMLYNVIQYNDLIKQAKNKNADIIVFPEHGITTMLDLTTQEELLSYTTLLPNIMSDTNNSPPNPCNQVGIDKPVSAVVSNISCAAKENSIYIVINLPERIELQKDPDVCEIYNTNVVFNRKGDIIAKYRKYNLYKEPLYNREKEPALVSFKTDFGVTFGIFTCFDIMFDSPAQRLVFDKNITDFVYPTAWKSELPFLTAIQVQSGWARSHGINLLAANYVNLNNSFGGSGIYSGLKGFLNTEVPVSYSTHILVAKVPKLNKENTKYTTFSDQLKERTSDSRSSNQAGYYYPAINTSSENMFNYTHSDILSTEVTKTVQHGSFSCDFSIEVDNLTGADYKYKMVAYQGERYIDNGSYPIQVCSIVACLNNEIKSCGVIDYNLKKAPKFPMFKKIIINGNFANHNNTVIIPSTVTYDLQSLPYSNYTFTRSINQSKISLQPEDNTTRSQIMGFGIYSHSEPNNSSKNLTSSKFTLVLMIIFYFIKNNF